MKIIKYSSALALLALACSISCAAANDINDAKDAFGKKSDTTTTTDKNTQEKDAGTADKKVVAQPQKSINISFLVKAGIIGGAALAGYFRGHRNGYEEYEYWINNLRGHFSEHLQWIANRLSSATGYAYREGLDKIYEAVASAERRGY